MELLTYTVAITTLLFATTIRKLRTLKIALNQRNLHSWFNSMAINMKIAFSILYICFLKVIHSHDSESAEVNRIEITPFYDTIIVNDIADLLNEFQNTNLKFNGQIYSESESDENIEDLLSEYHNYLEKARDQRKSYLEKSKTKNKVPLLRHDKYIKTKPTENGKYNSYYFNNLFNPSGTKFPHAKLSNNLNSLMPINSKLNKPDNANHKDSAGELSVLDTILKGKNPIERPVTFINPVQEPIKCKQCLMPFDLFPYNRNDAKLLLFDNKLSEFQRNPLYAHKLPQNIEYIPNNVLNDSGNNINIRIKVDVQLHNAWERLFKNHQSDKTLEPEINSKEISTINLSLPYFNYPISMDLLEYKKYSSGLNKHDNIHQITIHKKKKPRLNINKKHRKKVITFHNIKVTSPAPSTTIEVNNNFTNLNDSQSFNNNKTMLSNKIIKLQMNNLEFATIPANITDETAQKNDIKESNSKLTFDQNDITANLSNRNDVDRDDSQKIENSIETEYTKTSSFNVTTKFPILMMMRTKREVMNNTTAIKNMTMVEANSSTPKYVASVTKESSDKNNSKKTDKTVAADSELLYWPNIIQNKTFLGTKNITTLILERENKKNKLNISIVTIRNNHTKALEQVIFGKEVDWDDVDTVVPTFISFVGKYIRGVLTLCSHKACHSIKCEEKKCMHRICDPENRLNKKGHCLGSNATDSVASMESIMDLPSKVAFEIVDILQDNMLGKLFGKMTLCISTKCSTFLTSKKYFMKSKCITKNLDNTGHCPNVKSAKN